MSVDARCSLTTKDSLEIEKHMETEDPVIVIGPSKLDEHSRAARQVVLAPLR